MKQSKKSISGWNKYPITSSYLMRPERYRELRNCEVSPLIARGLGRSYGDASLNTNHPVMLMERLNRFLSFDEEKGILRAEAGVSLEEILQVFVPRGWFLPVTPGTKFATLGGCVATDVHGKNHHVDGAFAKYVKSLEIILADGSVRKCSPKQDPDLFWATVGGMGLTGIISEVSLQLLPIESAYMIVKHHAAENFEQVWAILSNNEIDDKYSVAWIDCLSTGKDFGRSIVMNGHHAVLTELPLKIKDPLYIKPRKNFSLPFNCPSWLLNPWTIQAFNTLYFRTQAAKKDPFVVDYDSYFYPLDSIANWNRLYGKKGFLQYQFVVPTNTAREALKTILEELTKSQRVSFLAVLKRFGRENEGFLSFPREGYTLALDIPIKDDSLFSFLDHLDRLVLQYGGRIYLAKDARMKPDTFRAMYPRLGQWQRIKTTVDPQHRFSSDLSRRLEMEKIL